MKEIMSPNFHFTYILHILHIRLYNFEHCFVLGMTESSQVTHDTSLLVAQLEDEIRKQVGVIYPED